MVRYSPINTIAISRTSERMSFSPSQIQARMAAKTGLVIWIALALDGPSVCTDMKKPRRPR